MFYRSAISVRNSGRESWFESFLRRLGVALRRGVLEMVRGKIRTAGAELDHAAALLQQAGNGRNNGEIKFLQTRLQHAKKMSRRASQIFDNPILKMFGGG